MRQMHDLSRFYFSFGRMGRIMVPQVHRVMPGDRFQTSLALRLKMSPLNYGLRLDPRLDCYTFYQPLRHVLDHGGYRYDTNPLVKMVEEGIDYTGDAPWIHSDFVRQPTFLGMRFPIASGKYTVPLEYTVPYLRAWDEYFRHPVLQARTFPSVASVAGLKTAVLSKLDTDKVHQFGIKANHLKTATTAYTDFDLDDADRKLAVASSKIDLIDLDKQIARLKSEAERELFEARYRDIISKWGGKAAYDSDNRPRMLSGNRVWLSGSDVYATDQGGLGTMRGVTQQNVEHGCPPFRVPEHGVIFTMVVLRLPVVNATEIDQGDLVANRTYLGQMGDAHYVEVQEPHSVTDAKFYQGSTDTTVRGYHPFGNWMRYTPSFVHPLYDRLEGMPFNYEEKARLLITDKDEEQYDNMFASIEFGHFELSGKVLTPVARALPSAARTMMPFSGRGMK